MSKIRLVLKQLFFLGLYTVFFAVQLHYKYTYVYSSLSRNQTTARDVSPFPGSKLVKAPDHDSLSGLNLKLNKRYVPSDLVEVLLSDYNLGGITVPRITNAANHSSVILSWSGFEIADRGPPEILS